MDNAVQAIIMAFAVFVLVIALTLSIFMLSKVTNTAEKLLYYTDSTRYYDNIELANANNTGFDSSKRIVDVDTIIPTLYRYDKENFCVKIYDAIDDANNPKLIQIFDVNLEGKVRTAVSNTEAKVDAVLPKHIADYALKTIYNNTEKYKTNNDTYLEKRIYMFGAPWTGSPEGIKTRIDYFINGKAGYINDQYVDYTDNAFYKDRNSTNVEFEEKFISYSYSGDTFESEEGDTLVRGAAAKDKIVIVYTIKEKIVSE